MYSRKYDPRITNFKVIAEYELDNYTLATGWIILETFKVRDDYVLAVNDTINGSYNTVNTVIPKENIKFLVGQTIAKDLLYGE